MERLDRFQVFVMERSKEHSVISLLLSALQLEFEIGNWIQLLEFDIRIHSISYLFHRYPQFLFYIRNKFYLTRVGQFLINVD